jgi:hypothetical protein
MEKTNFLTSKILRILDKLEIPSLMVMMSKIRCGCSVSTGEVSSPFCVNTSSSSSLMELLLLSVLSRFSNSKFVTVSNFASSI